MGGRCLTGARLQAQQQAAGPNPAPPSSSVNSCILLFSGTAGRPAASGGSQRRGRVLCVPGAGSIPAAPTSGPDIAATFIGNFPLADSWQRPHLRPATGGSADVAQWQSAPDSGPVRGDRRFDSGHLRYNSYPDSTWDTYGTQGALVGAEMSLPPPDINVGNICRNSSDGRAGRYRLSDTLTICWWGGPEASHHGHQPSAAPVRVRLPAPAPVMLRGIRIVCKQISDDGKEWSHCSAS